MIHIYCIVKQKYGPTLLEDEAEESETTSESEDEDAKVHES